MSKQFCTIFILWKTHHSHQTFSTCQSWHQLFILWKAYHCAELFTQWMGFTKILRVKTFNTNCKSFQLILKHLIFDRVLILTEIFAVSIKSFYMLESFRNNRHIYIVSIVYDKLQFNAIFFISLLLFDLHFFMKLYFA